MKKPEKMTKIRINEIQIYMQLFDKSVISKKTLLNKIGINYEEEIKQIEEESTFLKK